MNLAHFTDVIRLANAILSSVPVKLYISNYTALISNPKPDSHTRRLMSNYFSDIKSNVDLSEFSNTDLAILDEIGIVFISLLKHIVVLPNGDIKHACEILYEAYNRSYAISQQLFEILSPLENILTSDDEEIDESECKLSFSFESGVSIGDTKQLKKQSNDLNLIISGYARILKMPVEEVRIFGIHKNSPVLIDIVAAYEFGKLFLSNSKALLEFVKASADTYELLGKFRKNDIVKELPQFGGVTEQEIKKLIDAKVGEKIDKLAQSISAEVGNGDGEDIAALRKALYKHNTFIINGGTVNIYLQNPESAPSIQEYLKASQEVSAIRSKGYLDKIEEGREDN